jgi:hypothetical protein
MLLDFSYLRVLSEEWTIIIQGEMAGLAIRSISMQEHFIWGYPIFLKVKM